MNTLGKSITHKFFKNPEDYLRLRKAWSQLMRQRTKLHMSIHVYYLILCGKNWTRAFTMPKRFTHVEALAIIRTTYRLPSGSFAKKHTAAYEFFAEYLAEEADDIIADLLDLKSRRLHNAIKDGKEIEPYVTPAQVQLNA